MLASLRRPRLSAQRHFRIHWLADNFDRAALLQRLLPALALVTLAGCSVHPIPDDVTPIPTEEIVRSARCELRLGLFEHIERVLNRRGINEWKAEDLQTKEGWAKFYEWLTKYVKARPADAELLDRLKKYGQVAAAYDFDFNITEHDNADAAVAFKLPLTNSTFDLSAGGTLHKTRQAQRTFKAQETFGQLVTRDIWCIGFRPRERNLLYPISGTIGLRKVVETFVEISEQGGGKDSFVDTLTFTTTIGTSVTPSIKINPVPNSFRLVSANGTLAADRTDIHKVTISLAFPQEKKSERGEVLDKDQKALDKAGLLAPYEMNTLWRARYNICVADARNREDTFKALRLSAPEVYCITYADAFVPRYADSRAVNTPFQQPPRGLPPR
jgi:hypothetical protein